jgi:hypothetical protein
MKKRIVITQIFALILTGWVSSVFAIDSDATRLTLRGLAGVTVVVEEMQPGLKKYGQKLGLQREQIKTETESILRKAGISVLTYDQWLKTPGRPFLYIVINTHEYEKYWYAYDVRAELRQRVLLEANPSVVAMASTWSINVTGNTHIGRLGEMKGNLNALLEGFIGACRWADRPVTRQKGISGIGGPPFAERLH